MKLIIKLWSSRRARARVSLKGDYTPNELKEIIGGCDLFIGMRMHSNIAALSSFVPTIAISHSLKTQGIMKDLGQEEWVCDIRLLDYEMLISKIDDILRRRKSIMRDLRLKVKATQELSLLNAELVKKLLDSQLETYL